MSSEDDATASQGGEDEFKDAARGEGEEKEEEKIPTPLPSPRLWRFSPDDWPRWSSINAAEKIKELEPSLLRERDARREAEATLNSLDRIHEWLAARNDIVKRLSGALGEHSDASLVKSNADDRRVAKRPPTSNWIEAIQSRFNDKRTDATLVALAKRGRAQVAGSKATSTAKPPAKPTGGKGRPPPSKVPAHLGASLEKS
ncbi:hypothetical protein RI054_03g17150 [Pseudoscourfieldia marina]